ncbi:hypothetical protein EC988_001347 [Linderina pennispora]|nr:hypothetical protein EC988_001347 [Linderina pennispora]
MINGPSLCVILDSPEVILSGSPGSASNAFITGRVVLGSQSAAMLRNLTVSFRPRRKKLFQSTYSVTPLIDIHTTLVEDATTPSHIIHTINHREGKLEWRFSLAIPGDTAETVFTRDIFIAYEVVAEARLRSAFGSLVASKPQHIAVKRVPMLDSQWVSLVSEPITETAKWQGRLELTLLSPSRVITDSQPVPVRGVLRPMEKGIKMLRAGFQITERTISDVDAFGVSHSISATHIINENLTDIIAGHSTNRLGCGSAGIEASFAELLTSDRAVAMGLPIDQDMSVARSLTVPAAYTGIQYDVRRGPVRVTHDLVFSAAIADESGNVHNLRLATPIFVLPDIAASGVNLPRYEEVGFDTLIEAATVDVDVLDTLSQIECTEESPLAVLGYKSCGDLPPPSYTGSNQLLDTSEPTGPQSVGSASSRLRRLCSRALLRQPHASAELLSL